MKNRNVFVNGALLNPCKTCGCIITEKNAAMAKYTVRGVCIDCHRKSEREIQLKWRLENKFKEKGVKLKYNYELSLEKYTEMLTNQNGVCAICKGINPDGRALFIDHNHETGIIRALLCFRCNTTLGQCNEDKNLLMELINYIIKHENQE